MTCVQNFNGNPRETLADREPPWPGGFVNQDNAAHGHARVVPCGRGKSRVENQGENRADQHGRLALLHDIRTQAPRGHRGSARSRDVIKRHF